MAVSRPKKKPTKKKKPAKAEVLARQLIRQRPQVKTQLERLLAYYDSKTGPGAFAPVTNGRCSACNLTIAAARLQLVKAGEFLDCAACGRFLYFEEE